MPSVVALLSTPRVTGDHHYDGKVDVEPDDCLARTANSQLEEMSSTSGLRLYPEALHRMTRLRRKHSRHGHLDPWVPMPIESWRTQQPQVGCVIL